MKIKWYICTLLTVFTLLVAFQENVEQPNQKIVLQFNDAKVNATEVDATILNVTKILTNAGAKNINIKKTEKGNLKISYFSTVDVSNIKEILSAEKQLLAGNSSKKDKNKIPKQQTLKYNFDVFDLDHQSNIDDVNQNSVLEIKFDIKRFTTDKNYTLAKKTSAVKAYQQFKNTVKAHKKQAFTKQKTSYSEPEVRAGPNSLLS